MARLVRTLPELERNIEARATYLSRPGAPEGEFALDLICRGICFVATTRNGKPFFAPSRFIGYLDNSRTRHLTNSEKDGRVTNPAISSILGGKPEHSREMDAMFLEFCNSFGIEARPSGNFGIRRKFWSCL